MCFIYLLPGLLDRHNVIFWPASFSTIKAVASGGSGTAWCALHSPASCPCSCCLKFKACAKGDQLISLFLDDICVSTRMYLLLLSRHLICFPVNVCCRCWMQLRLAERSMTRWLISSSLLEGPFRRPCRFSFNEKVCKNGPLKAAQTSCCPAQDWMYVDAWTDKRVNTSCYLRVVISYWTKLHLSNFSGAETPVTVTPRCRLLYSFCASVGYEDRQSSLSRPATV